MTALPEGKYGMQLSDGTSTHANDMVEGVFVQGLSNGTTVVELVQEDPVANTSTVLASQTLTTAQLSADNQIELQLTHAINATTVSGSFELLDNGVVNSLVTTFGPAATVYTGTVNWAQVGVAALTTPGVGLNVAAGASVHEGQTLTASATPPTIQCRHRLPVAGILQ